MCCGEAFWKRVVAFCLTFGLGVFVAGLFISGQVPQTVKPVVVPAAAENKNCVPIDKSLKYENLPHYEEKLPAFEPLPESDAKIVCEKQSGKCYYVVPDEKNKADKKPEDKTNSLKNETEKQKKSAEPQYYNPSKDSAEFKELLHKERCFETQAQ